MPDLFHVIAISTRTGERIYMTETPVTADEGGTILRKLSSYASRRCGLEPTTEPRAAFLGRNDRRVPTEYMLASWHKSTDGYLYTVAFVVGEAHLGQLKSYTGAPRLPCESETRHWTVALESRDREAAIELCRRKASQAYGECLVSTEPESVIEHTRPSNG